MLLPTPTRSRWIPLGTRPAPAAFTFTFSNSVGHLQGVFADPAVALELPNTINPDHAPIFCRALFASLPSHLGCCFPGNIFPLARDAEFLDCGNQLPRSPKFISYVPALFPQPIFLKCVIGSHYKFIVQSVPRNPTAAQATLAQRLGSQEHQLFHDGSPELVQEKPR